MSVSSQDVSFGNFDDLDPEEHWRVEQILFSQDSKVEFPWDTSDSAVSFQAKDSGDGHGLQHSYTQDVPYEVSIANQSKMAHYSSESHSGFYDVELRTQHSGDQYAAAQPASMNFYADGNPSEFFYVEQSKPDDSYSRGSKPYERRNKKKRPPEYYKKKEQEIQAERQLRELRELKENTEPRVVNWHEEAVTEMTSPYVNEVPQYMDGTQLYPYGPNHMPVHMQSHSAVQEPQNFISGLPVQQMAHSTTIHPEQMDSVTGAPHQNPQSSSINILHDSSVMVPQVSSENIAYTGPHFESSSSGISSLHKPTYNSAQNTGNLSPASNQNLPTNYAYPSNPKSDSDMCSYPVEGKDSIENMTHQVSDMHLSATHSGSDIPDASIPNTVHTLTHSPNSVIKNSKEHEIVNTHDYLTSNAKDSKLVHSLNSNNNCSPVHEGDLDEKVSTQELDPDHYPSLGGGVKSSNLLFMSSNYNTIDGTNVNSTSSQVITSSEDTQSVCHSELSSNVPSSSAAPVSVSNSASVWGGGGASKSSWAGLFRNVDPAKQGYIVPCENSASKMDAQKSVNFAPQQSNSVLQQPVKTAEDPIAKQLGEMISKYKVTHSQKGLQPRGLYNRGNWCYINATLQALVSCPPFYNLMKIFPVYSPVRNGKSSTPILDSIVQFVNEFTPCARTDRNKRMNASLEPGAPFEPANVYKMLQVMEASTAFRLGKQEDAEEFLSTILDGIHEEMCALIRVAEGKSDDMKANGYQQIEGDIDESSEDADPDSWEQVGPKKKHVLTRRANFDRSPLADIFVGYTRSALFKASSKDSATLQPFFTLQLDIQSDAVWSVRDALDGLVSKEAVTGFTCSQTKAELDVMQRMTLEELPPVLILHLKFFVYDKDGGSQKLMKKIDYTIDLEITKDLLSPNVRNKMQVHQRTYKLFAVVYHHGKKATGGHYTTAVFHPAINSWIMMDDSNVKQVNILQVLKYAPPRVPYLLYYRRVDMH